MFLDACWPCLWLLAFCTGCWGAVQQRKEKKSSLPPPFHTHVCTTEKKVGCTPNFTSLPQFSTLLSSDLSQEFLERLDSYRGLFIMLYSCEIYLLEVQKCKIIMNLHATLKCVSSNNFVKLLSSFESEKIDLGLCWALKHCIPYQAIKMINGINVHIQHATLT